jgi:hypothetical protein
MRSGREKFNRLSCAILASQEYGVGEPIVVFAESPVINTADMSPVAKLLGGHYPWLEQPAPTADAIQSAITRARKIGSFPNIESGSVQSQCGDPAPRTLFLIVSSQLFFGAGLDLTRFRTCPRGVQCSRIGDLCHQKVRIIRTFSLAKNC